MIFRPTNIQFIFLLILIVILFAGCRKTMTSKEHKLTGSWTLKTVLYNNNDVKYKVDSAKLNIIDFHYSKDPAFESYGYSPRYIIYPDLQKNEIMDWQVNDYELIVQSQNANFISFSPGFIDTVTYDSLGRCDVIKESWKIERLTRKELILTTVYKGNEYYLELIKKENWGFDK